VTTYVRQLHPSHCLSVASTQSGKTTCFAVPTILDNATDSLVIHDPKDEGDTVPGGELYTLTAGWRAQVSKVIRFQPLSATSHQYDPLRAIRLHQPQEIRDLQIVADMLADPDGDGEAEPQDAAGAHFRQIASDIHAGVLAHGLYTRQYLTLGAFHRLWNHHLDLAALLHTMETTRHVDGQCHPAVLQAVTLLKETADRELSALKNTVRRALRLWADPLVCRATDRSDFCLRDLREGLRPFTLYLSFPFSDVERLRPLSRLILRQCLEYAASRAKGWAFDLIAVLDEFQSLGRLPLLRHLLNYALGRGLTLVLITPSLNEVDHVWGTKHPFLEGCGTKMVFGLRDGQVANRFLESIGMTEREHTRTSWSPTPSGWGWRRTTSTESREEPLVSRTALLDLDDTKVLARIGRHTVLLPKAYYKDNPQWLRRSRIPAP
jgi:type IV secretion system protein VirD4